ncbi:single-stranded DNA cytosine deaminase-like [Acipenser oxyrinchus oxyrinchus]|uniref:Single-stranded DNA cytosine deaminase-like n=1 Tax=Acipenser oxyrinchus oxyrinchus TaxID=40147 RepID=A0AAD8CJ32_ACIOX|nr:single-stranded DNA cytosine deaminase-like [Acipenser oxyrinchus oxyrinchus]
MKSGFQKLSLTACVGFLSTFFFSSSFIKMNKMPYDKFTFHFQNLQRAPRRRETWLCQILRMKEGEPTLQVFKNKGSKHAEQICLWENEAAIQGADRYEITWYISWSPCDECVPRIIEFVKKHPNGKLNIFASRLYYCEEPDNLKSKTPEEQTEIKQKIQRCREGLGNLEGHGKICLKVMTLKEIQDCFHRFVEFKPWGKLEEDSYLHAEKLKAITKEERKKKIEKDKASVKKDKKASAEKDKQSSTEKEKRDRQRVTRA